MVGVIVNESKVRNGKVNINDLSSILSCHDYLAETSCREEVPDVLREFKKNNVGNLVIVGGDGTINSVIEAMVQVYDFDNEKIPTIIPTRKVGTIDFVSSYLNNTLNPRNALEYIIYKERNKETLDIVELKPLEASFGESTRFGFVIGQGVLYVYIKRYDDLETGEPSRLKASGVILKSLTDSEYRKSFFDVFELNVTPAYNGNDSDRRNNFLFASSFKVKLELAGITIDPFGELEESGMYLAYYDAKPDLKTLSNIVWGLIRGKKIEGVTYRNNGLKKFSVHSMPGGNSFTVDGEKQEVEDQIIGVELTDYRIPFARNIKD